MIFSLPKVPDSRMGSDYYQTLLQIEATKVRLRHNVHELKKQIAAPLEMLESVKEVAGKAAQIPLNALHGVQDTIDAHPWGAMGVAVSAGAVGGYFDDGRVEALLAEFPGQVLSWINTVVSKLVEAAAGAINQVLVQGVVGVVTGAVAAKAAAPEQPQPEGTPPEATVPHPDHQVYQPFDGTAPSKDPSYTGAV